MNAPKPRRALWISILAPWLKCLAWMSWISKMMSMLRSDELCSFLGSQKRAKTTLCCRHSLPPKPNFLKRHYSREILSKLWRTARNKSWAWINPVSSGTIQHVGTVQVCPSLLSSAPSVFISLFFAMLLYGQCKLCFFLEEFSLLRRTRQAVLQTPYAKPYTSRAQSNEDAVVYAAS